MKHFFPVLLCLFLCGCAQEAFSGTPVSVPEITQVSDQSGTYDPRHPMEAQYPGLVRAYPLPQKNVQGIHALGNRILLLSGRDCTTLTLLTGDNLKEESSLTLDFPLHKEDPSLQIHDSGISFFDPLQRKTLFLDQALREIRSIAAPEGLSGKPVLSPKGDTLFYCTSWSVMAWDLESGIRRTVKECSYEHLELTGIHLDGQFLECTVIQDGISCKQILSADQGLEIRTLPEKATLHTKDPGYFAAIPAGYQTLMIFGRQDSSPWLLLPEGSWQQQFYLPEDHAAVTASTYDGRCQLTYYELNTGLLRSSILLEPSQETKHIVNSKSHCVYVLAYDPSADCHILYRWDVLRQPPDPENTAVFTTAYPEQPDSQAVAQCREYARTIGEKYGIRILVGNDAIAVQPWDYRFEAEFLAPVLEKELNLLDQRLGRYPEGILEQTKSHFTGITLCLVRSITGTGDPASLSNATGIQFFENREAYVVITTGNYSEQALYHELFHVMETHILTRSSALDTWESLNPAGFVYGSSTDAEDIYLQGQTRAFVDRYSMAYPKEDRARILENAMLPDNAQLFQSEYMQRKLNALCTGIRESYGLIPFQDPLPWEQYLVNPLAPKQ